MHCLETEKLVNFLQDNIQMEEIRHEKEVNMVFKDYSSFSSSAVAACGLRLTSEAWQT